MRASRESFEAMLAYGSEGEHVIAAKLASEGHAVSPLFQFTGEGGGPRMLYCKDGLAARAVLPDLTCWRPEGGVYFVEVKRKRRWVKYHARGAETGFNLAHFKDYVEVERATGTPVIVTFIHEACGPTGVFVGALCELAPLARYWDGTNAGTGEKVGRPLVLFPRSALRKQWELSEVGL